MSMITEALWLSEFPDIPMPEDCEYSDFWHLCKQRDDAANRDWTLDFARSLIDKADALQASNPSKADVFREWANRELESVA